VLSKTRFHVSLLWAIVTLAAIPSTASADWHEPVAGPSPINASATHTGDATSLAVVGGIPYVAWNEDTTQQGQGSSSTIHVSKLAANGQSWDPVGDNGTTHPISLLASTSSDLPSLANVGGTPWVAWQEGVSQTDSEIRVSKLLNGSWTEVPPTSTINHPINHDGHGGTPTDGGGDASQPTLMNDGTGHPFVSFSELDPGSGSLLDQIDPNNHFAPGQIWVDQLNQAGDGWNEIGGGSVNADPSADALFPRMTVINGVPWVAYWQIVPPNGGPPSVNIDVAHLSSDGQSWVQTGPVVSAAFGQSGPPVGSPSIASVGGTPYVTFTSRPGSNSEVLVYSFDGNNWNQVGGGPASDPNADAQSPGIADVGGSPWVTWYIDNPSHVVEAARLVGGTWQQAGTNANDDPSHSATNGQAMSPVGQFSPAPSLASINGFPWIGFVEDDMSQPGGNNSPGCCNQVRVSRLEPSFLSTSGEPSDTAATLVASVETFGLPYPVGFKWGPGNTLTHTTPLKAAQGDPAISFTSIFGLKPSSEYSFMPVATAGTPKPLVNGPDNALVTQPAGPPRPAPLFAFIFRLRRPDAQDPSVRIRYFVSDRSSVEVLIRHKRRIVARWSGKVGAGTHRLSLSGAQARAPGGYVVTLTARSGTQTATDQAGYTIPTKS
jgi:hypothetical protein